MKDDILNAMTDKELQSWITIQHDMSEYSCEKRIRINKGRIASFIAKQINAHLRKAKKS